MIARRIMIEIRGKMLVGIDDHEVSQALCTYFQTNSNMTGHDINVVFRDLGTSVITNERVPNFPSNSRATDTEKFNDIISQLHSYNEQMLVNLNDNEDFVDSTCEIPQNTNMKRHQDSFSHLSLYIEEGVNVTNMMLNRARQLAGIIAPLAVNVYNIKPESIHLYRDIDGGIATLNLLLPLSFFSPSFYSSKCIQSSWFTFYQSPIFRASVC